MRRILKFMALGLVVFLPSIAYAGGGRETITEPADGIDIWQKEFNVSGMKPGLYNIIVNARDAAGNEGVSGPFNIRVDRIAGLPEAGIAYPVEGQIVRGDVSIIGVAQAAYGLKEILVKIDNQEYQSLEGNEYWNMLIPAEDLGDGDHTIRAKAVDKDGLEGPEVRVDFTLDVVPPAFELVGRRIGDMISGKVRIKGKVTDYNGIQSVSLSTNGGETYTSLRTTSGRKGDPARYFQYDINTKKFEDGPLVYLLRAVNGTGLSETTPILFFVNNYPPEIEILSPDLKEDSYGLTQVTGKVISGVGLTDFYYEWAGERHDIPLRPGDPFWSAVVHFSLANNRPVPFRVTAVDKSGNTTVVVQRLQDTRRFRTPTLIIDNPGRPAGAGRMQLAYDQPIYGHIAEGYFPFAVVIDGVVDYVWAQPTFRIPPEMIPTGNSTIQLWAMDEDETLGQPGIALRISKAEAPPGARITRSPIRIRSPHSMASFFLSNINEDDQSEDHPWVGDYLTITGSIAGYVPGHLLEYRYRWDDAWKQLPMNTNGSFDTVIDLSSFPEGPIPLEMRTVRNGVGDYPLYVPVHKYQTMPTIHFLTPSQALGPVARSTTVSGTIDYYVPLEEVSYTIDGREYVPLDFTRKYGRAWFNGYFDFTAMNRSRQTLVIRAVDRDGNTVVASPDFVFDNSDAYPKVILNYPRDGELVTGDFEINGLAYIDVGITSVFYRILTPANPWDTPEQTYARRAADVEFDRLITTQNIQVPVFTTDVRDGDNILEVFAEDVYGVQGHITSRVFKVSTAPPNITVDQPKMAEWNRRNVMVSGTAYDRNNMEEILVSMDIGASWLKVDFTGNPGGATDWKITLNSQLYNDGIYSLLIRSVDKCGVSSFGSTIVNIDNTPPKVDIGTPGNGDRVGVTLRLTGQVSDDIGLRRVYYQLINTSNPEIQISDDLSRNFVIMEAVDVSGLPDDNYTLKITAVDRSGNETTVIRNITIIKARAASEVAIVNPMPGIDHHGPVIVSGRITGAVIPDSVTLFLDRQPFVDIEVNRYGVYSYEMPRDYAWPGQSVALSTAFNTPDGDRIVSYENKFKINGYGPFVEVLSHRDGDVITQRPWLSGRAYVFRSPRDEEEVTREERRATSVSKVELSFDNGISFVRAKGKDNWKYRLETGELKAGTLPIIIKATFADGSEALRRILLTVDVRSPQVITMGPPENSRHRENILVYGSSSDDFDMDVVEVSLRPGDKAGYSVPSFIQGLYLDGSILGGLSYSLGLGLTFFNDNVKVQFNVSQAPSGRYEGWAFGGKVLANVFTLNMGLLFGPDWEFWKTSLALGAHFSCFMMSNSLPPGEGSEPPVWMGQLIGQWEIIKADMGFFFPKWKYFKSFSVYVEPGLWFAPSDVISEQAWRTKFTIGFGFRASLF
jgi:hypothetical protein